MNDIVLNSKKGFKINQDMVFSILIAVLFCHQTLFSYFVYVIDRIPLISSFKYFFFPILYITLFTLSFNKKRLKFIKIYDLLLILFFVISVFITTIFYPNNYPYIASSLTSQILPCVPFFFIGLSFYAEDQTINTVYLFSCIAIIINILYVFYFISSGRNLGGDNVGYSMYWSYLLLPNIMIVIEYAFRERKLFSIFCSILGIIYTFAMGTRGPIVILFFYIVVSFWISLKIDKIKKIFLFLIAIGFILLFFYSPLYLNFLSIIRVGFMNNGVSTRVIDYLINGEIISYTSGRLDITQNLLIKLWEQPIFGYGVYGEWPLGYYSAHNIYLEIVFHFGIILGSIMIVGYIVKYLKALYVSNNELAKRWLIMFGCLVFVKGIFGGRYMEYTLFFLLGFSLKEIRNAKIIKKQRRIIEVS